MTTQKLHHITYAIGLHGFLGEENNCTLPDKYYLTFGEIINNLHEPDGLKFRQLVHNLPEKSQEFYINFVEDKTDDQIKKIYNDFTFICQKYIWCCGQEEGKLVTSIPYSIGLIWYYCGIHRVVRPVSTYDALILNNWKYKDKTKPMTLENLDVIHSITGTEDEIWFYKIHIMVEYIGRKFVNDIINPEIIFETDESSIKFLDDVNTMINDCIKTISKMKNGCKPDVFWNIIRIYLSGFDNKKLFPNGLNIQGTNIYLKHKGGSGASSPLIQAIDSFFEVNHEMNKSYTFRAWNEINRLFWMKHKSPDGSELLKDMREYMSFKHRLYLKDIRNSEFSIRKYINDKKYDCLTDKYNKCLDTLCSFRTCHVKLVRNYIINYLDMIDKEKKNGGTSQLDKNNPMGKGGTSSLAKNATSNHALATLLYDISDDVKNMKIKFDKIDYYMNSSFIKNIDYIVIPVGIAVCGIVSVFIKNRLF